MKVLWVVNTIFPDAAKRVGLSAPVFGGWMYGLASDIVKSGQVKLAVATCYDAKDHLAFSVDNIQYFLIPRSKNPCGKPQAWQRVVEEFQPNLVHIHGTEYGYGMALMQASPQLRYVVSIQGLVSVYYRYYLAGMTIRDVLSSLTLRDVVRRDTLFHAREAFYRRGLTEIEYIQKATAVIGRTDWDFAHVNAIRPRVPYYFCNESLRDEFYGERHWELDRCERHTIFLSQASYPIKGLHQVLKAVALLKADFPDIQVKIAGPDITAAKTFSQRLRLGGYGRYIRQLLGRHALWPHVWFLGTLDAVQMRDAYLQSHAFICPSSIENSPNSLGEAQILGVPSIAAYVGGVPSMVKDGNSVALYRFEEYELLAQRICAVFSSDLRAMKFSEAAKAEASVRHDRRANCTALKNIYTNIVLN